MCPVLRRCVEHGVAYHHGGLLGGERRLVEEAFTDGVLTLLTCTSTLAAGINLPARRLYPPMLIVYFLLFQKTNFQNYCFYVCPRFYFPNYSSQRVIIRAPMIGCKAMTHSQYKQMIGRAGRAGFHTHGESFLLVDSKNKHLVGC